MFMRSNMTPISRFAGYPAGTKITGLNFGNGPWVLTIDDRKLGEFCTMVEAERAAWYEQGKREASK